MHRYSVGYHLQAVRGFFFFPEKNGSNLIVAKNKCLSVSIRECIDFLFSPSSTSCDPVIKKKTRYLESSHEFVSMQHISKLGLAICLEFFIPLQEQS